MRVIQASAVELKLELWRSEVTDTQLSPFVDDTGCSRSSEASSSGEKEVECPVDVIVRSEADLN